jgi:hypothetical protein
MKTLPIKDVITLTLFKQRLALDRAATPTKAERDAIERMFETKTARFQTIPYQFGCMLKFLN